MTQKNTKIWREANTERVRASARKGVRKYTQKLKLKVVEHYSNATMECAGCGISDIRVLSIDHINGKGNLQRRKIGVRSGHMFWSWLIKNNFPPGYQVLCMNCQWIKRHTNNECNQKDNSVLDV